MNAITSSPSESMPAQIPPGDTFSGGSAAPPPPPPQAAKNAVKLNTHKDLANDFMAALSM